MPLFSGLVGTEPNPVRNGSGRGEAATRGMGLFLALPAASCGGNPNPSGCGRVSAGPILARLNRFDFLCRTRGGAFPFPPPPTGGTRRNTSTSLNRSRATLVYAFLVLVAHLARRTLYVSPAPGDESVPKPILRRAKRPGETTFVPHSHAFGFARPSVEGPLDIRGANRLCGIIFACRLIMVGLLIVRRTSASQRGNGAGNGGPFRTPPRDDDVRDGEWFATRWLEVTRNASLASSCASVLGTCICQTPRGPEPEPIHYDVHCMAGGIAASGNATSGERIIDAPRLHTALPPRRR